MIKDVEIASRRLEPYTAPSMSAPKGTGGFAETMLRLRHARSPHVRDTAFKLAKQQMEHENNDCIVLQQPGCPKYARPGALSPVIDAVWRVWVYLYGLLAFSVEEPVEQVVMGL
mgnify:FL=1